MKANDAILKNMQTNMNSLINSNLELKNMFGQFMKMNTSSYSGSRTLPSNTITNPKENLKGITTRSGITYKGPTIPTTSFPPKVVERKTEVIKDTVPPTNNGSTKDIQPPIVQIETQIPISEPVVAPVVELVKAPISAQKPNPKPLILYPITSLADKAILLGADNHPPMLEKDMYDSWKSRMCLSKENGVTIPKKYTELSAIEAIQADCDVKATNIILQGLPPEVYALESTHKVVKELWERIQMLMQGTSLTKQERELNIKFLNTLPPEWSKFVTDVKLVRDMHTTNVDQLHAYLGQHEYHANEVRIIHERTSDPLVLVANHQMNKSPYQPHPQSYHQHQFQPQVLTFQSSQYGTQYHSSQYASQAQSSTPLSITYPLNDFQSSVNHNVYNPSSSIP
nr:reverse transcriptase domain-containing protein [Tanacetum cinerariifolium]